MALIKAGASGNWSAVGTWTGGVLPGPGDQADSFGFAVVIDQDITVASLINTNAGAGGFSVTAAPRAIVAAITATVRTVLTLSHNTGTVTVTGAVTGGTAAAGVGIAMTGTGVLTVTGNVTSGNIGGAVGINNAAAGTVNVTGNVLAVAAIGINNAVAGAINVTGNVTAGSGSSQGIVNVGSGTVTVTGFAKGGDGNTSAGVSNSTTGIVTVGRAIGNNYGPGGGTALAPGIASIGTPSTGRTYVYALEYGPFGMAPVTGHVRMIADVSNSAQVPDSTLSPIILAATASGPFPDPANVRAGTVYMAGTLTGTLAVPAAASVANGVAIDNTTGTAVLTAAAVTAAVPTAAAIATAVWANATRSLTTFGTLVADIWAAVTRTLTGGGSAPTVAEIRTELSVELGRIDVAVSTRNAVTPNTIAPDNATIGAIATFVADLPSAGDIATEVWDSATRTLTSAESTAPTVEDIRAELAPELALLDVAVSTRLADADYVPGGGGGGGGATASEIWEYAPRTLTQTAAQVAAAVTGDDFLLITAVTFEATLTGLNFPAGWEKVYWTVELANQYGAPIVVAQVVLSSPADAEDGLLILDGDAVTDMADQGSLVVAGNAVTLMLADDATKQLHAGSGLRYDVKAIVDSTSILLAAGSVTIATTPTQEIE